MASESSYKLPIKNHVLVSENRVLMKKCEDKIYVLCVMSARTVLEAMSA